MSHCGGHAWHASEERQYRIVEEARCVAQRTFVHSDRGGCELSLTFVGVSAANEHLDPALAPAVLRNRCSEDVRGGDSLHSSEERQCRSIEEAR